LNQQALIALSVTYKSIQQVVYWPSVASSVPADQGCCHRSVSIEQCCCCVINSVIHWSFAGCCFWSKSDDGTGQIRYKQDWCGQSLSSFVYMWGCTHG